MLENDKKLEVNPRFTFKKKFTNINDKEQFELLK